MLESLLNELRTQGHLRGEVLPPQSSKTGLSYWIIALLVIGGWLPAVFMLLFLGVGAGPLMKGAVGLLMTALSGLRAGALTLLCFACTVSVFLAHSLFA